VISQSGPTGFRVAAAAEFTAVFNNNTHGRASVIQSHNSVGWNISRYYCINTVCARECRRAVALIGITVRTTATSVVVKGGKCARVLLFTPSRAITVTMTSAASTTTKTHAKYAIATSGTTGPLITVRRDASLQAQRVDDAGGSFRDAVSSPTLVNRVRGEFGRDERRGGRAN